jgi:site-specific recombinase XerD
VVAPSPDQVFAQPGELKR